MVDGEGVLPYGAVPVLVGEGRKVLTFGQGSHVKASAKTLHGDGLTEGYSGLVAFAEDPYVVWVREVVVVEQGVVQRVFGA